MENKLQLQQSKDEVKNKKIASNGKEGLMKLSTDPQSVAARQRRHRISDRFKMLQSLIPGGSKMDTVSMLEEAILYVKFLKTQLWIHHNIINNGEIHQPVSEIEQHYNLLLNNINSLDSSPMSNAANLPISQQQFLYTSSTSNPTNYIPAAAAAGISGMPLLPASVPMASTFAPAFCCDSQDDT